MKYLYWYFFKLQTKSLNSNAMSSKKRTCEINYETQEIEKVFRKFFSATWLHFISFRKELNYRHQLRGLDIDLSGWKLEYKKNMRKLFKTGTYFILKCRNWQWRTCFDVLIDSCHLTLSWNNFKLNLVLV